MQMWLTLGTTFSSEYYSTWLANMPVAINYWTIYLFLFFNNGQIFFFWFFIFIFLIFLYLFI